MFGGRWNPQGRHLVYCAANLALAVLEVLVHIDDRKKLNDYHLSVLELPETTVQTLDPAVLSPFWQDDLAATRAHGQTWRERQASLALRVPSVILATEFNLLVNPHHPDATRLEIVASEPFRFDPRLWKSG